MLLYGKKLKHWIFSETIVVYDIKVGRCSHLNESFMRITADFNISSALRWAIQDHWSSGFIDDDDVEYDDDDAVFKDIDEMSQNAN